MSKWIRKNDKVIVIAGNDKGKTGAVLKRMKDRVVVEGVNVRKKHVKKTEQPNSPQVVEIEKPVHISNVMICSQEGKPVKLKVVIDEEGKKKSLVYQENGQQVVHRVIQKKSGVSRV